MNQEPRPSFVLSYIPFWIALALAMGIILGAKMFGNASTATSDSSKNLQVQFNKIKQILYFIDDSYVDTVHVEKMVNEGIQSMLTSLDPHSSFIPREDLELSNSQLEGAFDGVGIEFNLLKDTLTVVTALSGGPSEKAGIFPGDKIIKVNDTLVAGVKITTKDIFHRLRGKKGSKVKLSILRKGNVDLIDFELERDKIPTNTLDIAYMVDTEIGYMKVSRFGENTYKEFEEGLKLLKQKGVKKLILDLRGNPGGYMDPAIKIVDEFLSGKKLIVYTDGKGSKYDSEEYAGRQGLFEEGPVVILLNEGSASASEIVAGAMQDHDRALIVGRRSFGKGLVQKPLRLSEGSELRLTISRYYTPSGRCIQKPYDNIDAYDNEVYQRFSQGGIYKIDSSKIDESQRFKTMGGRWVYGGGGIYPDVFVPTDSVSNPEFMNEVWQENCLMDFAVNYLNENKEALKSMDSQTFIDTFVLSESSEQAFMKLLQSKLNHYTTSKYIASRKELLNLLKAYIGKLVWYDIAFYPVINQEDATFLQACKLLREGYKIP